MKRLLQFFWGKKPQEIIIVSGLPRSGTSLMMKMIEAAGIEPLIDNFRTPDEDNPKGYYEFERVKKLPDGDVQWLKEAEGKVVKIISAFLPYLPEEYSYRLLFMERDIHEILVSQKKMLLRRGETSADTSDEELAEYFTNHLKETERWLQQNKRVDFLRVSYNVLLDDAIPVLADINQFFNGRLDTGAMAEIIDPALYRSKTTI